jgi:hypothetical protein
VKVGKRLPSYASLEAHLCLNGFLEPEVGGEVGLGGGSVILLNFSG